MPILTDASLCPLDVVDAAYFRTDDIEPDQPFTIDRDPDSPTPWRASMVIAPRATCILDGQPGCWTVEDLERDDPDLEWVNSGEVYVSVDGDKTSVSVLASNIGHVDTTLDYATAKALMDHTGTQIARIRYAFHPEAGLVASGVLWPEAAANPRLLAMAMATSQSLDARWIVNMAKHKVPASGEWDGTYRLAGAVFVNTGGLPRSSRRAAVEWLVEDQPFTTVTKETPMTACTCRTKKPRTADYVAEPIDPIRWGTEVTLADGSLGYVRETDLVLSDGSRAVSVARSLTEFENGDTFLVVPLSEVTPTGNEAEWESTNTAAVTAAKKLVVRAAPEDLGQPVAAAADDTDATGAPVEPEVSADNAEVEELRAEVEALRAERDELRARLDAIEMAEFDALAVA